MVKRINRVAIIALALILCAFMDGSPDELDNGVGILAIDKTLSEIKTYLVKVDSDKLISDNKSGLGSWASSAWNVNLKKAGLTEYFGLQINSIEVYFKADKGEAGEVKNEKVYSFVIYTRKTVDEAESESFRLKLWAKYGEPQARMFSPDYTQHVYDSWFNDNDRMLDLVYGIDIATGDSLSYYEASYQ